MGMMNLHIKIKKFRLKSFLLGNGGRKRNHGNAKKPSWMMPITHGFHVAEHNVINDDSDDSDFDSVVIQREQMDQTELWYFGIFDALIGDKVTKFMHSHFFDKKLKEVTNQYCDIDHLSRMMSHSLFRANENITFCFLKNSFIHVVICHWSGIGNEIPSILTISHMRRKAIETLKKAYLSAKTNTKTREENESKETCRVGSTSVVVINGEKLVIANFGDYRTVLCRYGIAYQITGTHKQSAKRNWYHKLFSGTKHSKGTELVVGSERIDSDTEFLILASNGIWEVSANFRC
ncbi:putative protein-serine/threonine phosphatase [Lupinus albus]|uniref:PPM-type phosphatase domain-containing protein n=1 Tax=Lupinus albus TaxID=3870 RepID=A0A6A4QUV1_LUPAL|nr:putative protein-serine/threonine phosphatase [Lupinus albus]